LGLTRWLDAWPRSTGRFLAVYLNVISTLKKAASLVVKQLKSASILPTLMSPTGRLWPSDIGHPKELLPGKVSCRYQTSFGPMRGASFRGCNTVLVTHFK